ncbi:tRNA dihydrouridine synthase DusB [Aerococcaceae bacterium zg-ZJ1578]|uniref:tRNA dihydrouridine synthase DusB n=1 Tax=Aerococcaceae TaxID=186827 RepID=UPI0013B5DE0A|nr:MULTISPECIES: tRNA dihydrouridine synthase DusB [unclassified Facklamia]MBK0347451.1 tRNA dihydrouridine synthase DusB [Aerococcaceae bacterium zg-1578]MBS4461541.1 tRNA dihydrouridine synthase DusB [Aerococcaceae bacterium zg-B36]QQD65184.1 tRNA dihydrouridine synthase DusB [Aerococcaceae bacterium zg-252]NEW63835.1 tRNA dihydrouridine synthase DusB [Facklamia sp. 252]NEW67306.1 tRNA dihydrouridine synthase DusB [Facklamia sp. 253]
MFKIGDIQIDNPIVVAPMAGVSNSAFRTIVKQFGAGLVVCEMISDKGIQFRNKKTLSMLHIAENEYPLSIQIMGGNKETLVEAAKYVAENTDCAIIDINMGCPVNKVIKAEAGARWLLDPNKVYEMVASVVDAVKKPVTVKMRTGWDNEHLYAIENALAAERAGAAMVAMHGRTRVQMYEGKADWDILAQVKKEIKTIPFVGNGDVRTPEQAKHLLDTTGVDGVMVGRAALGNPWMIKQMVHYVTTGELLPPMTAREKIDTAIDHLNRLVELKGDRPATREFRTQAHYYLKGIPRASKVKVAINETEESAVVKQMLLEFADLAEMHEEKQAERKLERLTNE